MTATLTTSDDQATQAMTRDEARAIAKAFMEKMEEEAKIEHKLSFCGTWYTYPALDTGRRVKTQTYCNDYRHCERCNKRKVSEIMTELQKEQGDGEKLYYCTVLEEDWQSTSHRWRRKGIRWRQFPMTTGNVRFVVINTQEENDSSQSLPIDFFFPSFPSELPDSPETQVPIRLSDMLRTMPKDRRSGGKLGKTPKPRGDGSDRKAARVEVVRSNAPREVKKEAWEEAVEDTKHLNPSTVPEAEAASQERSIAYKKRLRSKGIKYIDSHFETRYVRLDAIQWGEKREDIATDRTQLGKGSLGWYKSGTPIGMFPPVETPERAEISP